MSMLLDELEVAIAIVRAERGDPFDVGDVCPICALAARGATAPVLMIGRVGAKGFCTLRPHHQIQLERDLN